MSDFSGVTINMGDFDLANGRKGKLAVFLYSGKGDPKKILDAAISAYVEENGYNELIDANLDNPWMKVILSDVNEMIQEQFDPSKHKMKSSNL